LHDVAAVPRWAFIAIAACSGDLHEKVGSEVDASVLTDIPPPACAAPAAASDPGDCTGGGQPGDDCLMCHHQGGGATTVFAFAGTLFDTTQTVGVGSATIVVQDSVGNVAVAVTHDNGNFYATDGFAMFPAKAFATLCPDVIGMVAPVDSTTGANCNTAGCHTAGFRVHVP
jgi:hypothetical protein